MSFLRNGSEVCRAHNELWKKELKSEVQGYLGALLEFLRKSMISNGWVLEALMPLTLAKTAFLPLRVSAQAPHRRALIRAQLLLPECRRITGRNGAIYFGLSTSNTVLGISWI